MILEQKPSEHVGPLPAWVSVRDLATGRSHRLEGGALALPAERFNAWGAPPRYLTVPPLELFRGTDLRVARINVRLGRGLEVLALGFVVAPIGSLRVGELHYVESHDTNAAGRLWWLSRIGTAVA